MLSNGFQYNEHFAIANAFQSQSGCYTEVLLYLDPEMPKDVPFFHAISDSDSTSLFYGKGKKSGCLESL